VFTRRFFDEQFSRLSAPSVEVLDNYQKIPADSIPLRRRRSPR